MLTGHANEVSSVAIARSDKFVVSGSYDYTVRIWDTATGELLRKLEGVGRMESVAVSPDCQHIASGSNGEVWVWTKDGIIEHKLEFPSKKNYGYQLIFSHDGLRILCNADGTEWTTTGHRLSPQDTDEDCYHQIGSVAYSPNDSELVCGLEDGAVMIWNTETNKRHILGRHPSGVISVSFSLNGSRIAYRACDGTVRIWDPKLTIDEEVLKASMSSQHSLRYSTVALSHDGRWIVTAPPWARHRIYVWSVTETITKTNQLRTRSRVESHALSCDGNRVVIACETGVFRSGTT